MIGAKAFRKDGHGERGFILVWMTVLFLVLIGIASLVVDLGLAYVRSNTAAQAADAAATVGVTHLPNDVPGAIAAAKATASENGFQLADSDIQLLPPGSPTRMQVTIHTSVNTFFATAAFGNFGTINISKSSEAAYYAEGKMGSPDNVFGNEPDPNSSWRTSGTLPQMWGTVNGPQSRAEDGDPTHHWTYKIDVSQPGSLDLQVFDPMFTRQTETIQGAQACGSFAADHEWYDYFRYSNKLGSDWFGNLKSSQVPQYGWVPSNSYQAYKVLGGPTLVSGSWQSGDNGLFGTWTTPPHSQNSFSITTWLPTDSGHWGGFLQWFPDIGTWQASQWGITGYTQNGLNWPPDPFYGGPVGSDGKSYPYCTSDETLTGAVPWYHCYYVLNCLLGGGALLGGTGYDPRQPVKIAPPESFAKRTSPVRPASLRAAVPNADLYLGADHLTCPGWQSCTYPRTFYTLYRYDLTQPDQIGQEVCTSKTWDLDPGTGVSSSPDAAKWFSYALAMNSYVLDAPDPGVTAQSGSLSIPPGHYDILDKGFSGYFDPNDPYNLTKDADPLASAVGDMAFRLGITKAQALSTLESEGSAVGLKYQAGYRVWANYVGSGQNGVGTPPECGASGTGNLNGWNGQVKAGESYILSVSADCSHVDANPDGGLCYPGIGAGSNHYSLRGFVERAGVSTPGAGVDPGVTIAGDGNESIYTVTTGTAKLFLSKAVASGTKRTLHVHLFDIGDAETPGTLSIRDDAGNAAGPAGSTPGSTPGDSTWLTDDDCKWYVAKSKDDTSPANGMQPITGCSTGVYPSSDPRTYNNKWLDFLITIPANYQCTPGIGVDSCWLKAYIDWQDKTQTVHDVTSWYAWIEGDPVRLVAPGGT